MVQRSPHHRVDALRAGSEGERLGDGGVRGESQEQGSDLSSMSSTDGGKSEQGYTQEKFFGRLAFPACRQTMSLVYQGVPAAVVQAKSKAKSQAAGYVAKKTVVIDGNEEMNGDQFKRAVRTPLPSAEESENSWDALTDSSGEVPSPAHRANLQSVALTPEEVKLLKELRAADKHK